MNTITDEQIRDITSIMISRFVKNNEEELTAIIAEQVNKHNLTGLAKKRFEIEFLFFKIKQCAAMN